LTAPVPFVALMPSLPSGIGGRALARRRAIGATPGGKGRAQATDSRDG
jgi:hypothetical protein